MAPDAKTMAAAALAAHVRDLLANPIAGATFSDPEYFTCILDLDGTIVEMSDFGVVGVTVDRAAWIGIPWWHLPSLRSRPMWEFTWRARLARAQSAPARRLAFDDRFATEGLRDYAIRAQLTTICEHDEPIGFVIQATDSRNLREIEHEVAVVHGLLGKAFDRSAQRAVVLAPDGTVLQINDRALSAVTTQMARRQIVGMRITDLALNEPDGAARAAAWEERLAEVQQATATRRYVDLRPGAGATELALDCFMTPIRDDAGTLEFILVELRERVESYVIHSGNELGSIPVSGLLQALPHMMWITDADDRSEYMAPRWATFTGRSLADLKNGGLVDSVHPDDREFIRSWNSDRGPEPFTFRMRRHDGEWRWMEAMSQGVYADDGSLAFSVGLTLDVTARHQVEDEMRAKERQLRATLDQTGFGGFTWNVQEDTYGDGSQVEEILKVPVGSLSGDGVFAQFFELVHPDDRARATDQVLASLVPGGPHLEFSCRINRPGPDGPEEIWVSVVGECEFDEHGQPLRLVGVLADVTEDRQEEDLRLRNQKLEAMGTLAGGIAHDFNNVIGAILSYARLAEAELENGESPSESLGEIARGAFRAGEIVRRLLTFSRAEKPRRVPFDLGSVVEEAKALLRPTLPPAIELNVEIAGELPPTYGDPTQLHQVAVNLITNAGQELGVGPGRIDVAVDSVVLGDERPPEVTTVGVVSGMYVRLQVRDDGAGIPPDVVERIFDPFFTTKGPTGGTGLGLSAAQSIVQNHAGAIRIESWPGTGSTFTVLLPVHRPGAEPGPVVQPPLPGYGTEQNGTATDHLRVLFVDDEEALVRLAHRALPFRGCEVTGFTDPREALAALEASPEAFDALVTDLSMPGLSGLDVSERARELRSDLAIVLTSGYLSGGGVEEAHRRGVDAIVPKPCSIDDLVDEILRVRGG